MVFSEKQFCRNYSFDLLLFETVYSETKMAAKNSYEQKNMFNI